MGHEQRNDERTSPDDENVEVEGAKEEGEVEDEALEGVAGGIRMNVSQSTKVRSSKPAVGYQSGDDPVTR